MARNTSIRIRKLPARNFYAGEPRNPATYIAETEDGRYFEAFQDEYPSETAFRAAAVEFLAAA